MKTITIRLTDSENVTLAVDETFKDLRKKLERNDIEFDINVMQVKGKPLSEDLVVAKYLNIGGKEPEDDAVEFVLPDLPDSAAVLLRDSTTESLRNGLLCRLCGIKTEDPIEIFADLRDISEKIKSLIPISISQDDQLSKYICSTCYEKLEAISEFVGICKETEKKLNSVVKSGTGEVKSCGKNSDIWNEGTIYKCPNCRIELRITRSDESGNSQSGSQVFSISVDSSKLRNSSPKNVTRKSHNLRRSCGKRRAGTRIAKVSWKRAKRNIIGDEDEEEEEKKKEEKEEKEEDAIGETERFSSMPSMSTRKRNRGENTENRVSMDGGGNLKEKGKMKLRDIRKRIAVCETSNDVVETRKLESDALENVLFSINTDLETPGITGEFVELDSLGDNSNESVKKCSTLKCELCKVEYYSQERYLFHLERHESENSGEISCDICQKEFSSEEELWEHRRQYHLNDTSEVVSSTNTDMFRTLGNNKKSTKSTCEDCGARFVLRERYEFHMERHKQGNIKLFSCTICEKRFKSENILWDHHQYQHKSGERFACLTCDKTFVKRANLNYHLKTFGHKGGKVVVSPEQIQQTDPDVGGEVKLADVGKPRPKITCADCGARFVLQERYEFHTERHKSGNMETCVCNLCGRESTNENVLWDHYRYMHKRTKRYACTTCGKLFHKQSMLGRHQLKYGHKGAREIDVDTEGNTITVDSAAFKKVIAEEVVEIKSVNCVLCGEVVWGVDPNLINDAVTCASCEGPGLSLQVDSDGAKVISRRQYHCNMCNKHFTTKDRLEYHIMRHSENMDEFICSTCGKELSTEQALFEHYLFVHKGARPHVCELCGKSYQFKARLKEHMRSHSGERPFACEICGQRCMTNNALRSHKRTHITEKRFPCQICKKAFRKRQDLNEHLERHWKNDKTTMFPQVFSCAVCLETFPTFRVLKKHMKGSHSVESQDPILTELQPWFECEDCHEKFKHQMSLKVHRERAHEGKMRPVYNCDICNVTYKNARVLSNHIKNKHEGGKRYKCAQCGKEYNQSTSLHNHILLHTGEKPFGCEHCEMTFRTKESRDHHRRKHTGERPYKCPRCEESFATTTQRREHRKREHDEGNTHSCPECGKICFDEHGVRSHLNTHFSDRFNNKNTRDDLTLN